VPVDVSVMLNNEYMMNICMCIYKKGSINAYALRYCRHCVVTMLFNALYSIYGVI